MIEAANELNEKIYQPSIDLDMAAINGGWPTVGKFRTALSHLNQFDAPGKDKGDGE